MHSFDFDPSHVTRFVDADGTITFQIDLSNSESSVGARQQPRQHSSFNNLLPPTRSAVQFFIKACFKPEQLGRIDGSTLAHCCNILRMIPTLLLALQLTIGNSLILWQNASEHTYTRAFFIQAVFPMVHLCSLPLVFYLCLNRDSIFWKRPSSTASTWVARGLLGLHVFAIWCHKLSDATYKKEYMTTLSSNILIFTVLIMYSMNQKTEHWEFNMYLFLFFGALIWMAFVVWRHSNQGTLLRTLLWLVACDFMPKYVLRMTEVLSGQTMLELFGLSSEFDYPMDWVTYLAHRLALVLYTTKSVVASVLTLGDATAITALTITPDYPYAVQFAIFFLLLRAVFCCLSTILTTQDGGIMTALWSEFLRKILPIVLMLASVVVSYLAEELASYLVFKALSHPRLPNQYSRWGMAALTVWLGLLAFTLFR